jgi:hypothetical protein
MALHGWGLWVAWGLFGFMQLATARYLKGNYSINMVAHTVLGILILLINSGMCIVGLKKLGWQIKLDFHNISGIVVMALTIGICFSGLYAQCISTRVQWKTRNILRWKIFHKCTSWVLIIFSQVTLLTGVLSYNKSYAIKESPLGIVHISLFFVIVIICEISY